MIRATHDDEQIVEKRMHIRSLSMIQTMTLCRKCAQYDAQESTCKGLQTNVVKSWAPRQCLKLISGVIFQFS